MSGKSIGASFLFSVFLLSVFICLSSGVRYSAAQSTIDYEAAAELYENLCASCHGVSGDSLFPNQSSFTSVDDLVSAYDGIGAHGNVTDCDTDCVESANTYIWDILWGNNGCTDRDGDTYPVEEDCGLTADCDDTDASVNPGAAEVCTDTIDNDCDGLVDCEDSDCSDNPDVCSCTDNDDDGYYAEDGCGETMDCDDTDAAVSPVATEIAADGIDNDCDGEIDETESSDDSGESETDDDDENTGCFINTLVHPSTRH